MFFKDINSCIPFLFKYQNIIINTIFIWCLSFTSHEFHINIKNCLIDSFDNYVKIKIIWENVVFLAINQLFLHWFGHNFHNSINRFSCLLFIKVLLQCPKSTSRSISSTIFGKHVMWVQNEISLNYWNKLNTSPVFRQKLHPDDVFRQVNRQYGPVFTFWMGNTPLVLIADVDIGREAFRKNEFSGRPESYFGEKSLNNLAHFKQTVFKFPKWTR